MALFKVRGNGRERGDPIVVSKGKNEQRVSSDNPLALSEGKGNKRARGDDPLALCKQ